MSSVTLTCIYPDDTHGETVEMSACRFRSNLEDFNTERLQNRVHLLNRKFAITTFSLGDKRVLFSPFSAQDVSSILWWRILIDKTDINSSVSRSYHWECFTIVCAKRPDGKLQRSRHNEENVVIVFYCFCLELSSLILSVRGLNFAYARDK